MDKKAWFVALMLLALLSVDWNTQAATDQFTPVVVSPFTSKTQPVLGTDGKYHAVYELEFANIRPVTATLKKIEVLDANDSSRVIATYEGGEVLARLRTLGNTAAGASDIEFNGTRLFLIHLSFDSPDAIPLRLLHHLDLLGPTGPGDPTVTPLNYTAAPFELARPQVPVLGPPLAGTGWVAINGCCEANGAHRATALPVNGRLYYAQRYAIDWMRLDDHGRFVHGDLSDVHSYSCYGADVLAVANGTVVDTLNTLDD
ncbi:MAG: M23 family peptidase, partial [Deltaproteobacteria bacterium]|nr:M23 family peptidase [Deltaproteobacteria bacterium]